MKRVLVLVGCFGAFWVFWILGYVNSEQVQRFKA